ncbi:TonB-dependent receptor [Altererythrobacter sp. KTW20L]|uniref:TonB-dependent receptor n=1 Tax=Altererythrobacter sp. KTW20L TaxID=2942210 RepID=UPI0020BDF537|nr:TonB-dependent receptor [Altererythrobacter sp. KTW20L]MCL6249476.1 TonB-dependent receptor [Altererythrobacter sp. KTW20L]
MASSCAVMALAMPALAQDAENEEASSGRPDTTIIVTAERRATNLQETPLSIIALTNEMVEAKGIEDLQDLARFTPNLSITPARGAGNNNASFVMRGIAGGGGATGERGVGLYIDGIYMPRTSGAILQVLDVERIEVLRGPQGTLFGRNSTGGAIRIFSQQPTDELAGYGKVSLSNLGRFDLVGMLNVPVTDTLAVRVQGATLNQQGYMARGTEMLGASSDAIGRFQARFEPSSSFNATLGLFYSHSTSNGAAIQMTEFDMRPGIEGFIQGNYADWVNDSFKLAGQAPLAAFNDSRIVTGDPYRATSICLIDDFHPDYGAACDQFTTDDYFQADLNMSLDLSDTLTLSTVTGYSTLKHRGNVDFSAIGIETRTDNVDSDVFYQEVQLNAALFDGVFDLVVGGNYFWEDSLAPNESLTRRGTSAYPASANGDGDAGLFRNAVSTVGQESTSFGLFASGTLHIGDSINLTGGVRRAWDEKDYFQERFASNGFTPAPGTNSTFVESSANFSAWDWRGTADWRITPDIMLYATASKAYKAGSFSYTVVSFTNANQATGPAQSAGIRPIPNEKVVNFEAGLRMDLFNGVLRLNPTVFRMDFTNRQAAVQVTCGTGALAQIVPGSTACPVGFLIQVTNQGDVRLEGVELDGLLSVTDNLFIDGSMAYFTPKLISPPAGTVNLFPDAPSPTFNVGATWFGDLSVGELQLNANYTWQGEMETHPSSGTDSSYTLPSYGLVNARARLQLNDYPISFTLFASNLLDKTYATFAQRFGGGFWDSGSGVGPAAPPRSALSENRGRPREVGLTIQYNF